MTSRWLIGLAGEDADIAWITHHFPHTSEFRVVMHEGRPHLALQRLDAVNSPIDVRRAANELLGRINRNLRAMVRDFQSVQCDMTIEINSSGENKAHNFGSVEVRERDDRLTATGVVRHHYSMTAEAGRYRLTGNSVDLSVTRQDGSIERPTLQLTAVEKLDQLRATSENVRFAADALAARPINWGGLYTASETVSRMMDLNAEDRAFLKLLEWSAQGDRHSPIRGMVPPPHPMTLDEAEQGLRRLFICLVEQEWEKTRGT